CGGDESVTAFTRNTARVCDAFEVPVLSAVVRVHLPIVSAAVVSAVPVQWNMEVAELSRRAVSDTIDSRINGAPSRVHTHCGGGGGILRESAGGDKQQKYECSEPGSVMFHGGTLK